MLCEEIIQDTPGDAIVTWKDGKDEIYCLRPQTTRLSVPEYNPTNGPVIPRHFSSAIFEIGQEILVKVKYAPVGWPRSEGHVMRLVRDRAPSIPIPEIIHYWIDEEWDRSFLIMRRVHGQVLDHVWFTLSDEDQHQILAELAAHVKTMAEITSPRYEAPDGEPIRDNKIVQILEDFQKWYAPRPQRFPSRYSVDEFRAKIREDADGVEPPKMDPPVFHFHHDDMGPENVIVSVPSDSSPGVHVAGIIDWEQAGFYPKFYIMLDIYKPLGGYLVSLPNDQENPDLDLTYDYSDRLASAIEDVGGFPNCAMMQSWYLELKSGWNRANARRREERRARVAAGTT